MKKRRLSCGLRKYIRRQKFIIKRTAKDRAEEKQLVKALLEKFYKNA
jgi:hypothetical protein